MRGLMAAVIVMGVLIVMGTTTLIVMLVERMGGDKTAQSATEQNLPIAAGARVISANSDGKNLILLLAQGDRQQIEVRNLVSGQLEARYNIETAH